MTLFEPTHRVAGRPPIGGLSQQQRHAGRQVLPVEDICGSAACHLLLHARAKGRIITSKGRLTFERPFHLSLDARKAGGPSHGGPVLVCNCCSVTAGATFGRIQRPPQLGHMRRLCARRQRAHVKVVLVVHGGLLQIRRIPRQPVQPDGGPAGHEALPSSYGAAQANLSVSETDVHAVHRPLMMQVGVQQRSSSPGQVVLVAIRGIGSRQVCFARLQPLRVQALFLRCQPVGGARGAKN